MRTTQTMRHDFKHQLLRERNEKGFSFLENIMGLALITLVALLVLPMLAIASAQGAASAGGVTASAKLQGVIENVRSEVNPCNTINSLVSTPLKYTTANGTEYLITAKFMGGPTTCTPGIKKALDIEFRATTIEEQESLSRLNTKVYIP